MATNNHIQSKPDPALKRSVRRARLETRRNINRTKRGTNLVVSLSLAATLLGWGIFSRHDAEMAATAQLASAVPTVTATAIQQDANNSPTQGIIVSLASSINQGATEATATATAEVVTPQAQIATATATVSIAPVAMTRSSR